MTQDIFIVETSTKEESNALKAFAKALKLKLKISKEKETKLEILRNIQKGFKELELIEQGKLTATNAKDFLDEL